MKTPTETACGPDTEQRFQTLFEQAPFSVQLLAVDGRTMRVNQAWKDLWATQDGDALLSFVLTEYNMLADPQLEAKGVTPLLRRAFAGEAVRLPAAYYDPTELGKPGRARWVEATARPIKDDSGRVVEVMLIHEDVTERLAAERRNQDERERLARLFEQAPSFMAQLEGPSHRFVLANRTYTQLVGREVIGATVAEVLPEAAGQGYVQLLDQVYRSGEPHSAFSSRYDIQASPGMAPVERFVDFVYQPIRDDAGAVSGIFVQGVEVTGRVTAQRREQALAELSERFRALQDGTALQYAACEVLGLSLAASRVGYGTIDPVAETLHVARDWTAAGVETLAGSLHLRDYGSFIDNLKRGEFISIADVRTDERTAAAAGALESRSARSFVNVPVLEQGRLVAVLFVNCAQAREWTAEEHAFIRDVAERTRTAVQRARAEQSLRESEAKFRTIADAMPQMVWSTLPDGYHDYYNQQWYDFTGVPPGSTDGEGWNGVFHPQDQPLAWDVWRRSLATGASYEIEYRLRHRSGEYRWVLGRALPVRGDDGAIVRWMGTCTDIHEQKRAQEELLANNRRKDDFLAMLAHELRNPLAPISTAAQLLKAAPTDVAKVERSADVITRQVRHMTELVDDLLDVSRVTRGLVELESAPVEMKTVVGNAIEQVRPLIEARGHQLTTRMASGEVRVLGDHTRLVQVVSNLLNNAAKYTPLNGAISLTVSVGTQVEVRVADNGVGMDAQLLPRVFELFTQAERTPDRAQGGLGLGLALVRSLVELHGGQVRAESQGRGQGSVFILNLPLLDEAAAPAAPTQHGVHAPAAVLARRVMVVDDNRDAAETLGMLLESLGHDVRLAHDPAGALEAAGAGPLDFCILDIGLPGMDGYTLAKHLRTHPNGSTATFIALTGYGSSNDRLRGEQAGFDHYLVKPADLAELERLLQLG